jgi:hypothetical protein
MIGNDVLERRVYRLHLKQITILTDPGGRERLAPCADSSSDPTVGR